MRDATEADTPAIGAIRVAAWRATYDGVVPAAILARMDPGRNAAWFARRLAQGSMGAELLVIEQAKVIRGYAVAGPARDDDAAGLGEVEAIYLAPEARGNGLGTRLLEATCRRLAGSGFAAAVLWVLTANEPARRFYEARGFEPDGAARILDFEGSPIEEVRYRRSLA